MAPACVFGVWLPPFGLLERFEPATDDSRRPTRAGSEKSEALLRRACAMADGASKEPGNMPSSPVGASFEPNEGSSVSCSSSEELSSPAAMRAAFAMAASMHS